VIIRIILQRDVLELIVNLPFLRKGRKGYVSRRKTGHFIDTSPLLWTQHFISRERPSLITKIASLRQRCYIAIYF